MASLDSVVKIRPYEEHDQDRVEALFIEGNDLYLSDPSIDPNLRRGMITNMTRAIKRDLRRIQQLYRSESGGGFWVAVVQSDVVGMIGVQSIAPDVVEIRRLAVAARFHRRGVASQLVRYVEQWVRRDLPDVQSITVVTLSTMTNAVLFYAALGYGEARRQCYPPKSGVPAHVAQLLTLEKMIK